jgi:hypothetical protein
VSWGAPLGRLVAELVWLLLSTAWLLLVAAQESGVPQALWGIALVVNAVVMGARVRSAWREASLPVRGSGPAGSDVRLPGAGGANVR